mmetsp:Transcript_23337/g.50548  ORF Transcript_23337/g.50548 Transcript_23337/m.50548 type:complete len:228 (+) Transcript_23337:1497-2180(+)
MSFTTTVCSTAIIIGQQGIVLQMSFIPVILLLSIMISIGGIVTSNRNRIAIALIIVVISVGLVDNIVDNHLWLSALFWFESILLLDWSVAMECHFGIDRLILVHHGRVVVTTIIVLHGVVVLHDGVHEWHNDIAFFIVHFLFIIILLIRIVGRASLILFCMIFKIIIIHHWFWCCCMLLHFLIPCMIVQGFIIVVKNSVMYISHYSFIMIALLILLCLWIIDKMILG